MAKLDRQTIDRIAEASVSGRRGYGSPVDQMADVVAGLTRNRLQAAGAGGARRIRARAQGRAADRGTLALLLERAGKHLAWHAHLRDLDGDSQPQ